MKTNSSKNNIGTKDSIIKDKIKELNLDKIARQSGFSQREARKITPENMLRGFFLMVFSTGSKSFEIWAAWISSLYKDVSRQAVSKRMTERYASFTSLMLQRAMRLSIDLKRMVTGFENIILHDSTAISLNKDLSEYYPGSGNQLEQKKSVLKIQVIYNLVKKKFLSFELTDYRKNDLSKADSIVEYLHKGDLLIRDLGYFSSKVFNKISGLGAYYISRMKWPVDIYSAKNGRKIRLLDLLRNKNYVDIKVEIGSQTRHNTRLVALRLDENRANERRERHKEHVKKDGRIKNISQEYLELLGWEIFITNAEKIRLSVKKVAALYRVRWRIEIIFKSWKSYFQLTDLKGYKNKQRVDSYIYSMLIFIILFQTEIINQIETLYGVKISLLKFSRFISSRVTLLVGIKTLTAKELKALIEQIINYCRYEERSDRINYQTQIEKLS